MSTCIHDADGGQQWSILRIPLQGDEVLRHIMMVCLQEDGSVITSLEEVDGCLHQS